MKIETTNAESVHTQLNKTVKALCDNTDNQPFYKIFTIPKEHIIKLTVKYTY